MTSNCVDCGVAADALPGKHRMHTTSDGPACTPCNTARNRKRLERCDRERQARGKRHG